MSESIMNVTDNLQSAYDELYSDDMSEWRELCAGYKAANIKSLAAGKGFKKVLECGAGEGSILQHLDNDGIFPEMHAIEISDSGIEQIKKRTLKNLKEVKKFNGYEIPYEDNEFDLLYCSHVIEHVEHPRILLREIKRVSKNQIFEVPLDYSVNLESHEKSLLGYGHINVYTPSLFKFLLRSEGYQILNDLKTVSDVEVVKFNWYKNQNKKKTFIREMALRCYPLRNFLRKIRLGKKFYSECGFSAYTCLSSAKDDLKVF